MISQGSPERLLYSRSEGSHSFVQFVFKEILRSMEFKRQVWNVFQSIGPVIRDLLVSLQLWLLLKDPIEGEGKKNWLSSNVRPVIEVCKGS